MPGSSTALQRGVAALFAAVALAALPARANELQEASRLLKAGQHQQALERVNKVLSSKPRDPQARFLKGLIHAEQGQSKDAIEVFTRLTQDYPELPEPYNNLAVIYAGQGQYEKARAALEQSIRTHPSYATAYENLGDVYAKLASQAYDKALQLDSSNADAQHKLSLVRELVGRPSPVAVAKAEVKGEIKPAEPKSPPAPPASPPKPAEAKPVPVPEAKPAAKAAPEPKPAPRPESKLPLAADPAAEVLKTVNAWADAWSRKDVDAYLSHYAKGFRTPRGQPRADWEKVRRARLTAPKTISVQVGSPKVAIKGDEATVSFRQTYRSNIFNGASDKTLVLVRADGGWKILQETTD